MVSLLPGQIFGDPCAHVWEPRKQCFGGVLGSHTWSLKTQPQNTNPRRQTPEHKPQNTPPEHTPEHIHTPPEHTPKSHTQNTHPKHPPKTHFPQHPEHVDPKPNLPKWRIQNPLCCPRAQLGLPALSIAPEGRGGLLGRLPEGRVAQNSALSARGLVP